MSILEIVLFVLVITLVMFALFFKTQADFYKELFEETMKSANKIINHIDEMEKISERMEELHREKEKAYEEVINRLEEVVSTQQTIIDFHQNKS